MMRKVRFFWLATIALGMAACGSSNPIGLPDAAVEHDHRIIDDGLLIDVGNGKDVGAPLDVGSPPDASGLAFTTVERGTFGGVAYPFNKVIVDKQGWEAFWAQLKSTMAPRPPLPSVDFDKEVVLAVGIGERPSTGYAATITGLFVQGTTIQVEYVEGAPGYGCAAGAAMTQPYHVVKLARQDLPFRFSVETKQGAPCNATPPKCASERAAVAVELERLRRCEEKTDCTTTYGGCPFGCYYLVNRAQSLDVLTKLMAAFNANTDCPRCAYSCAPPPTDDALDCLGGRCEVVGN